MADQFGKTMAWQGAAAHDRNLQEMPALLEVLGYVQIASPIATLLVFLGAFVASSVMAAKQLTPTNRKAVGPGGRPLPKRSRSAMSVLRERERQEMSRTSRLVFRWLALGVAITFVANAAVIMAQTVIYRSEHWWRGKAAVVCS